MQQATKIIFLTLLVTVMINMISVHAFATSVQDVAPHSHQVDKLRLIDSKTIPHEQTYNKTKVGGISGITYNPKSNKWYLLSDDRSEHSPSRFYEANLNYNLRQFNNINIKNVNSLKQPNGSNYISKKQFNNKSKDIVADPESIRFDPLTNNILYTGEGDRSLGLNPFIRFSNLNGNFISELPINESLKMDTQSKKGFRNNLAIEGSTFSVDGTSIWTSMEAPVIQDGPVPTADSGALSRITQYDRRGNVLSEYAYPIDSVPHVGNNAKTAENGVSEMLAINKHEFLTLERASVQSSDGTFKNYVRIYKIDINHASDIKDTQTLQNAEVTPVKKKLVANLNDAQLDKVDNIEGMTFGKKLANGNDSLVVVSDNNFNKSQISQFIVFEVVNNKT
ncbi:esterase-like activity of phytase family protein [Staphylococcus pseudoxylosus]|uniref:esterase-like activity of phytase family protein n=1 Tax=Staphylococcus pseudoxylosus TaxID=2282419 RepID=UPI002DBCC04F|nr:esterase-like activity of phytase family protein [Staphylococcus pseudoxylosus]MEB6169181.1 esterase-like activity of phytase family protein [Staphylococcus pseudoxylosus]